MSGNIYDIMWKHRKTAGYYRIVKLAVQESNMVPVVVYQSALSGAIFTRPVEEFFDGRFAAVELAPDA